MKLSATILVTLIVLVQSLSTTMIYSLYEWRKEYIATRYCVNIDKPEKLCSGVCFVNELLQDLNNDTDPHFPSVQTEVSISPYLISCNSLYLDSPEEGALATTPAYNFFYQHLPIFSSLDPPRV